MNTNEIDIQAVTSKALREKKYLDVFPEYYDLEKVTENSLWHDNQNVLDHVIGVFEGLETVLRFEKITQNQASLLNEYLSKRLVDVSRKEALVVATLLHDIAKTETLVKSVDGTTRCPGHELIAASRIGRFTDRFGLNKLDAEYVERIVRYHGLVSDFLSLIVANENQDKYLKMFQETVGDARILPVQD